MQPVDTLEIETLPDRQEQPGSLAVVAVRLHGFAVFPGTGNPRSEHEAALWIFRFKA